MSTGLVPVIQHVRYKGRILESVETVHTLMDDASGKGLMEVSVAGIIFGLFISLTLIVQF